MKLLHRFAVPILAVAALAACEKSKTELLPEEVARNQPPKVVVTEETALVAPPVPRELREFEAEPVRLGDTYWQVTATEHELPARMVRQVASAEGLTLYALSWDEAPYGRLLTPVAPGVWQEFRIVY